MDFVGSIPKPCIEQVFKVVDLSAYKRAIICCSGTFRFERTLAEHAPHLELHSNDVSLISTAFARYALKDPLAFTFTNRLAFLEEAGDDPLKRLGALLVAQRLCHYQSETNPLAVAHFEHYRSNAADYIDQAATRAAEYLDALKISSYSAMDFREHAHKAADDPEALVFAWPPTYKAGYERLFKLINENVTWDEPDYGLWDPSDLEEWLHALDQACSYVVYADRDVEGYTPNAIYTQGRSHPARLITNASDNSSIRRTTSKGKPFKFKRVDVDAFTEDSEVQIVQATAAHMNYIKNLYLKLGLVHSTGALNWLVFVDGMLAGGFIYEYSSGPGGCADPRIKNYNSCYLLSDFSCSQKRRLSKLICMLAAGQEQLRAVDLKRVQRTEFVFTTAFTDKPISMKYHRGTGYKLISRKPGYLNYACEIKRQSNQDIYRTWFRKHWSKG